MRIVLRAKIHRAYVTGTNPNYSGSVTIDRSLMEKVDLWDYEQVMLCNITNGNRWETYVVPGQEGSGVVEVQGAGARLCQVGDCLIILAFEVTNEPIEPKIILVNQDNQFVEYLHGVKHEERVH